jgi:Uma2 family endonuclease
MGAAGLFAPEARVELIEGEVVDMPPIGSRHNGSVSWLANQLILMATGRAVTQVQGPIRLGDFSEPVPDIALLHPRTDFYRDAHPEPADVYLIIEVAESSLRYDLDVKMPLYARYGIPEAWLVDLQGMSVTHFSEPGLQGYARRKQYRAGDRIAIACLGQETIPVSAIFGG